MLSPQIKWRRNTRIFIAWNFSSAGRMSPEFVRLNGLLYTDYLISLGFCILSGFNPARAWNLTHVFDIFIQSSNDILLGWHENVLFIWMDWMSKMLLFDRTLRRKRNVDSMKTDSAVNNFSSSSQQLLFIYSLACSVEYLQWQHFVFICLLA